MQTKDWAWLTTPLQILEANMRLKLSGPDYRDKDPVASLRDFKARVKAYEKVYQQIGEYEERQNLQYIQVITGLARGGKAEPRPRF